MKVKFEMVITPPLSVGVSLIWKVQVSVPPLVKVTSVPDCKVVRNVVVSITGKSGKALNENSSAFSNCVDTPKSALN